MIFLRCDQLFHIFILFVSVSPVLPGAGNGDVISTLIEAAEPPVGFSGAPIWNDVKLSHVGYWGYYSRFTTFFLMGPHLWMLMRCITKHQQQIGGLNQQTSNSTIYSELMPIDFIISPILDIEWGSPQGLVQWTKWIYFTVMGCFSPNWLEVNNVNIPWLYPGTPPTAPPNNHEFAQIFVARVSHEVSAFGRHGQPRHFSGLEGNDWVPRKLTFANGRSMGLSQNLSRMVI